jgi:hypothetical protein
VRRYGTGDKRLSWNDFGRLRKRSPADLLLLAEATLWLGIARAAILTVPFRWIVRLLALQPGVITAPARPAPPLLADRMSWAFRAAAARTPWQSTCLAQAFAASGMMRLRGVPATISLGVAKNASPADGLEAHAWLSCGETILTGEAGHKRYLIIAQFSPRKSPTAPRQSFGRQSV